MLKSIFTIFILSIILTACQNNLLVQPNRSSTLQGFSGAGDQRETIGTARELYSLAQTKSLQWSTQARLSHIEGNFIAASGRNEFPIDAVWTFSFVNPTNPFLAYQVIFRSEYTKAVGQEVPKSKLKSQVPLDEKNWLIDSSKALQTALLVSPMLYMPVTRVELFALGNQAIWQIPSMHPLPPLKLNANTGNPVNS